MVVLSRLSNLVMPTKTATKTTATFAVKSSFSCLTLPPRSRSSSPLLKTKKSNPAAGAGLSGSGMLSRTSGSRCCRLFGQRDATRSYSNTSRILSTFFNQTTSTSVTRSGASSHASAKLCQGGRGKRRREQVDVGGSSSVACLCTSSTSSTTTSTTANNGSSSSSSVVSVDAVCEEQGFLTLEGVGHTVPPGTLVVNEKTGEVVAYVAYNLKEMDPTQFRAIALPVGGSRGAVDFKQGQELKLVDDEVLRAPRAKDVLGKVLNHFGGDYDDEKSDISNSKSNTNNGEAKAKRSVGESGDRDGVPFFNDYPGVDDRESIGENFYTGVKAVDAIVPVGKGQSMLIMGRRGTKKTTMALDMLRAHKQQEGASSSLPSFVYCCDKNDLGEVREAIREARLEERSVVIVTDASSQSKGERYTGMLLSLAIADDLRDQGGEAVVFLDDLSGAVHFWEEICELENSYNDEDMNELLEVDGMLIARFDALQRQFFSNILQRSAKMSTKLGGGSLTLFGLLQGEPMREDKVDLGVKVLKHQNLDPKIREKLLLAIANQVKDKGDDSDEASSNFFVSTRTVEEFKSISDGHILMAESNLDQGEKYDIVPSLSTTRLGVGRVAAPGMMDICSNLQLMLQQNIDAQAYGNLMEVSTSDQSTKSALVLKMLSQTAKQPVPANELILMLFAILDGYTDDVSVTDLEEVLDKALAQVLEGNKGQEKANVLPSSTSALTPEAKDRLRQELDKVLEKKKIKAAA